MGALRGGLRSRPPWMAGKLTPMWLGGLLCALPAHSLRRRRQNRSLTTLASDDCRRGLQFYQLTTNDLRNGRKQELSDSKLIPQILVAGLWIVLLTCPLREGNTELVWKNEWRGTNTQISAFSPPVALHHFNHIKTQILLDLLISTQCASFWFLVCACFHPCGIFQVFGYLCCFSATENQAESDYLLCEALKGIKCTLNFNL